MSKRRLLQHPPIEISEVTLALICLFFLGAVLIALGTVAFVEGSLLNRIFVSIGLSMAPSAVVAWLFRVFLFREIYRKLIAPLLTAFRQEVKPELYDIIDAYRNEIDTLRALHSAGIVCPYSSRAAAVKDFASAVEAEEHEIIVIGSSLLGLLQKPEYKDIAYELRRKVEDQRVRVKWLFTHPAVADLRANQEDRPFKAIGEEIISSLKILHDWRVRPEVVKLYKGTPTIFGIKTSEMMFLNPYPYGSGSYRSPCLIVEKGDDRSQSAFFYAAYEQSHFSEWDTAVAEPIRNFRTTIAELTNKLDSYAESVAALIES